jgi:hypothetical protein
MKGALVHAVNAGLITIEKVELITARKIRPGGGDARTLAGLGAFFDRGIEEAGFDAPEAALTPHGGDHFLNDTMLHIVRGIQLLQILME